MLQDCKSLITHGPSYLLPSPLFQRTLCGRIGALLAANIVKEEYYHATGYVNTVLLACVIKPRVKEKDTDWLLKKCRAMLTYPVEVRVLYLRLRSC